jgi:hypothetical protein
VVEIQYDVVYSPYIKCHDVDGWVSIGCVVGFLARGWWGSVMVCGYGLLSVGGCVLSGKELV